MLLFTDGDCVVPPTWADEMLGHFQRPPRRGGAGPHRAAGRLRAFSRDFQAFEQPLLNQYNFGSVGIGMPTGCFGNNMAIRARAVKEIGGFHALGYSVTEDAMLLDAVCRKGGWKVTTCTSDRGAGGTRAHRRRGRVHRPAHAMERRGAVLPPTSSRSVSFIFVVLFYLVGSLVVLPLGLLDWRVPVLSLNSFLSIGLLAGLGGLYPGKNRARYYLRFLPYLFFFGVLLFIHHRASPAATAVRLEGHHPQSLRAAPPLGGHELHEIFRAENGDPGTFPQPALLHVSPRGQVDTDARVRVAHGWRRSGPRRRPLPRIRGSPAVSPRSTSFGSPWLYSTCAAGTEIPFAARVSPTNCGFLVERTYSGHGGGSRESASVTCG